MPAKREVEIKFRVADEAETRRRLVAAGAASHGVVDEENYFCDDCAGSLRTSDRILRLRLCRNTYGTGAATLTYKEPVSDPRFKVRNEIEVAIGDLDSARAILEKLGYHCRFGYRKRRETWAIGDVLVTLDRLDFGHFIELEGPPDSIARLAGVLGFDLSEGLTTSYLAMADQARSKKGN